MFFFHVCLMRLHQFIPSIAFPDQLRPWRYVDQGQHGQLGWGFVVPSQWGGGPLSTKVWHHTHPQTFGAKQQGLERQQCNRWGQIPMFFFCQFGRCVWCLWNTAHDISWPLKLGPGLSLEYQLPLIQGKTNVGLWPSSEVWIWYGLHKDLCILFVFKLCFGNIWAHSA